MGRLRGGLTTKVHALVDADGLPVALKLSQGQANDGREAADMFGTVEAGHILLADRAYDSDSLRHSLEERGAWGNIRLMPRRKNPPPSWLGSTASVMPSKGSSTDSNTSAPSLPDTTKGTITSSLRRNWHR
jgi:hypothetical protein